VFFGTSFFVLGLVFSYALSGLTEVFSEYQNKE